MYIPQNSITLDKVEQAQLRVLITGYWGTGKTWAALTFPNPVVINIDRGLVAHSGRKDVVEVPMWSDEFRNKLPKKHKYIKDDVLEWIDTEGRKLEADQTLVVDGITGLQNSHEKWAKDNPKVTREGKIDDFYPWNEKVKFFGNLMEVFKMLRCHVVMIGHETDARDKQGNYNGKIRPLLRGQFVDELGSHFTDCFRQITTTKKAEKDITQELLKNWGMTKEEYLDMCKTFSTESIYAWQTMPDDISDCKACSLTGQPMYIPARYESMLKYMRKAK